jgi:SH3 domain-containing YSC84-like protein 1
MCYRLPVFSLLAASGLLLAACQTSSTSAGLRKDANEAQGRVNESIAAVERMRAEPTVDALVHRARGVLVVPNYGKGAWIVGGQGGEGVLLVRHEGSWSDPAFYTLGGLSIGLQAGGAAGPVALILMTDKAIEQFEDRTTRWSLGADAGLTVVNYSGEMNIADTSTPPADVVFWSGTKGLFGGVSVGGSAMTVNSGLDNAYYGRVTTTREILTGRVNNPQADPLRSALQTRVAAQ